MHKVLKRQLERMLAAGESVPVGWQDFLAAISDTYTHYDEGRTLSERSLDLSSKEMVAVNQKLQKEEEILKLERDRARAILVSMNEGLIVVDQNRLVTIINPAAERLLEVQASQALGQTPGKVISLLKNGQQIPTKERPIFLALEQRQPIRLGLEDNVVLQTNSGRQFPVAFSTAPLIENGQPVGAVIIFRDITSEVRVKTGFEERVFQTETEAKERRAELMASVRDLDIGFILTDANLSVTLINQAAIRLVGGQLTDSISLEQLQQTLGDGFDLIRAGRRCLQTGQTATKRNVPFGDKYLHFYLSPITVEGQESATKRPPTGVAILAEDTTEARLLERSKDEFFSIASHELRTPLSAIRGNTAMIKRFTDRLDKKQLMEMVDDIHQSSVRMIELVSDFLDLSRLQQGKIKFLKQPFALEELISEVVGGLSDLAKAGGIKLVLKRSKSALPAVLADPDRVKQVLINLIGNAIKFTEEGSVTVKAQIQNDQMAKVSVSDTGRGMSQESKRLLFHKFQQTGESLLTRDTTRGTGLGLYISRLLIEEMGGQIGLSSSTVGEGSTFAFTLPVAPTPNNGGRKVYNQIELNG
ncbi:MAG: ATP-binding protein [Patescibacteria group bacterium]